MTVDKYTPYADGVVGESDVNGPKVETDETFTEAKILAGSTAERFPYPTFNRLMNRADNAIKWLLSDSPPGCSARSKATALNLYTAADCFTPGISDLNRFEIGDSGTRFCTVQPCVISGEPRILVVDLASADASIIVVNPETGSIVETVDLSAGLPSATWSTNGVCTDEDNAYVCFEDSSYNQYVQAYSLADWSVATGWPATGTDYGTGSGTLNRVKIINATETQIAIASNNALVGTREMLTLIDKSDGSIADTGNGDSPATGAQLLFDLCSNGEYLFFAIDGKICSASIADLTTGCGGTAWPRTVAVAATAAAGNLIVGVGSHIAVATVSDAGIADITPSADTIYGAGLEVAYDGLNFWALIRLDPNNSGEYRFAIARLDIEECVRGSAALHSVTSDMSRFVKPFAFLHDQGQPTIEGNLIHDGRDFWWGHSYSGNPTAIRKNIYRFPLTHWR